MVQPVSSSGVLGILTGLRRRRLLCVLAQGTDHAETAPGTYNLEVTILDAYKAKEFDLYSDLIVAYSDWPTYSYGIKQIAKQIGFTWRDPDPSGANSIAWYNDYLADPSKESVLQRIL